MSDMLQERKETICVLKGLRGGGGSTADWRNRCGFGKTMTLRGLGGEVGVTGRDVGHVGGGYSR